MMKKKFQIIGSIFGLLLLCACAGKAAEEPALQAEEELQTTMPQEETPFGEQTIKGTKTPEQPGEISVSEEISVQEEMPVQEEPLWEEVTPEPESLGNPRSSFGLGSAPFLKGDVLLVSMFVTTPESSFSEEEKQDMLAKVGVTVDYIEKRATDYNTEVQVIYDYQKNPSLYVEATTDFCINEETDFLDRLDEEIAYWFETCIDYEALISEYDADGIATMVMVNNPGISYAIVYDGTDNVKESLVLFSKDYYNGGKQEKPVTYAHEILHLFGAHDLYEEAEYTAEVTDYVEQSYPKEIMLTVTGSGNTKTAIDADLSPITAYHLGWIDTAEEIDLFPQLNRE